MQLTPEQRDTLAWIGTFAAIVAGIIVAWILTALLLCGLIRLVL